MNPSFNQVKERLIASLQGGAGGGVGAAQEARLEELQLEREHLQAQLQASQQHAHSLRADVQVSEAITSCTFFFLSKRKLQKRMNVQELEDRHGSEVEQLLEQVREAEAALAEERVVHEASRAEVTQLTQEVEGCREERARERDSMATQLRVRAAVLWESDHCVKDSDKALRALFFLSDRKKKLKLRP